MKTFLISYIEDNELGVYHKEILVEAANIAVCFKEHILKYPTLYGIKQVFGMIEDRWKDYYTHESQDLIQKSKNNQIEDLDRIFSRK